jgi:hypothetical protein
MWHGYAQIAKRSRMRSSASERWPIRRSPIIRVSTSHRSPFRRFDAAFDAIEETLQKDHRLLNGASLTQAEPTPQFDTHEVFTFPWLEPEKRED